MATQTTNTPIDHSSDAGFRAWATVLRDLLLTGGALEQTADTGQLDLATATRPATTTDAAPMFFRFTDSLQATAPYVLAVYVGTGNVAGWPRIRVALGTGTTGSGALTGVLMSQIDVHKLAAGEATARDWLACGLPGDISVCVASSHATGAAFAFVGLHRVRDAACAPTADGVFLYYMDGSGNLLSRSFRRVPTSAAFGPSAAVTFVPLGTTASVIDGGARLVYPHETALPDVRPVTHYCTCVAAEFSAGLTFVARPVGPTNITYIFLGGGGVRTPGIGLASAVSHGLAMRWE
jgi:hypothetical protein